MVQVTYEPFGVQLMKIGWVLALFLITQVSFSCLGPIIFLSLIFQSVQDVTSIKMKQLIAHSFCLYNPG